MIIREIELNNFRIYYGKNKLDFSSPDPKKNIHIVSGKNGFGKTTLLMSLVWCLYGRQMTEVDELYSKEISDQGGYPKYISGSLNRQADAEGTKKFSVSVTLDRVSIPEIDCKEVKVTRTYITDGSNDDDLELLIDGHHNQLTDDVGPEIFIREFLLPKEIAKFFFFDAEKIVTLAESTSVEHNRILSNAYSEVLGIKKYEELKANLESIRLKLKKESAGPEEEKLLNSLETEVENLELDIAENNREQTNTRDQIDEKRLELNQIQSSLIRAGESITVEELNELREQDRQLTEQNDLLASDLKSLYDTIPFAIAGLRMAEVVDQLEAEKKLRNASFKKEEAAEAANKILTDLLLEEKSFNNVIPANIHEFYHQKIKQLILKHLYDGDDSIPEGFKVLHDFSDNEMNKFLAHADYIKSSFKEQLRRINGEYTLIKNELNQLRRKIRDAESKAEEPRLQKLRNQKAELESDIRKLEEKRESLIRTNELLKIEKTSKEKRINELADRLKVSSKNKKKDDEVRQTIEELNTFLSDFKEEKKRSLEKRILEGLQSLMHKKDFIQRVEVSIIQQEIDIQLIDKAGRTIRKESLSKGEQQMYATALLKGLVEESDIEFPVFIDSPMQKFDEEHATNIIKNFYPTISEQVVIFPLINKEMNKTEYELLKPRIAKGYLIENINANQSRFKDVVPDQLFETYQELYHAG